MRALYNNIVKNYTNKGKQPSKSELKIIEEQVSKFQESMDNLQNGSFHMKDAIAAIGRAIEAEKRGLKPTDVGQNVFKSKDNKYFTFIEGKFYPADSKGNYRINKKINEKGQKFFAKYDKDGNILSVQALNYQNKPYINPKYAAKVLGFAYDGEKAAGGNSLKDTTFLKDTYGDDAEYAKNGYSNHNTFFYKWDNKKHAFIYNNKRDRNLTPTELCMKMDQLVLEKIARAQNMME